MPSEQAPLEGARADQKSEQRSPQVRVAMLPVPPSPALYATPFKRLCPAMKFCSPPA